MMSFYSVLTKKDTNWVTVHFEWCNRVGMYEKMLHELTEKGITMFNIIYDFSKTSFRYYWENKTTIMQMALEISLCREENLERIGLGYAIITSDNIMFRMAIESILTTFDNEIPYKIVDKTWTIPN